MINDIGKRPPAGSVLARETAPTRKHGVRLLMDRASDIIRDFLALQYNWQFEPLPAR